MSDHASIPYELVAAVSVVRSTACAQADEVAITTHTTFDVGDNSNAVQSSARILRIVAVKVPSGINQAMIVGNWLARCYVRGHARRIHSHLPVMRPSIH